jgi:hypothetical protein
VGLETETIHQADPQAVASTEGAQIPGSSGYDYSRLAADVDAMELYDFGDNVEIVRSFNPRLITLLTSGAFEEHRVRRDALRGIRGLILWDKKTSLSTWTPTSPNVDVKQRPILPS